MAEKTKMLTCTFFVGNMPVKELSPEQLDKMVQRIGETMSRYYSTHPEEYRKIKGGKRKRQ